MKLLFPLTLIVSLAVRLVAAQDIQEAQEYSTLSGKVTDQDGNPLGNIRVDVSTAAPKVGESVFCPSCYLDCSKWAKTDAMGEFSIAELDPGLKFRLVAASPEYQARQTDLLDPQSGSVAITLKKHPEQFDPRHKLSGKVTSSLGIPIEGAVIEPIGAKTSSRRWWGQVDVEPTVTDNKGQFQLFLPDDMEGIDARVFADGFCPVQTELLKPGESLASVSMNEGARVTGKLVHRGKPVPNMSVAVVQTNRNMSNGVFIAAVGDVTREDGSFDFRYLPPNQKYAIYSVAGEARRTRSDHVLATKTFTAPASGQIRDLGPLEVMTPLTIRGTVQMADNQPVPTNLRITFGRDPAWDLISVMPAADGSYELKGLPPETYEVGIHNRKLELVSDRLTYQSLSPQSFGVHVNKSIDNLNFTLRSK